MKAGFCRGYTLQRTKLAVTIRDDELVVPQFIRTGLSMSLVRQNSQITQCVNNRMRPRNTLILRFLSYFFNEFPFLQFTLHTHLPQSMEIGVTSMSGAPAQKSVVGDFKFGLEPAVILHQLIEEQSAWEMVKKRDRATLTHAQVLNLV